MNRYLFGSWFTAASLLCSTAIVFGQHDSFEKELEEEREKEYHGEETKEEKEYYKKVSPTNIPSGKDYLQESHPLESAPLPNNPIPKNRIPSNRIPANKIPSNPI